jgi:phosphoglycerate dehydrogenase-like enzyme
MTKDNRLKIVFHGANACNFQEGFAKILGLDVEIRSLSDSLDGVLEYEDYSNADVIIGTKLDGQLPAPKALRLYHAPAAGTDAIDVNCLPANAQLCNCFGHEDAIAEYVMAALLRPHVPLELADQGLRKGQWSYWAGRPNALRTELGGQRLGLLGYGHIGKAVAKRAKAFGMSVNVANRSTVKDPLVDQCFGLNDLFAFAASSDVIVVSLPHTQQTEGIVNADFIDAMTPHAVLINVGRGPVVDEKALFDALKQKRIKGAVIDTWYQYPNAQRPECPPSQFDFSSLDNVLMTPHMSGWTAGMLSRRQVTIADNIRRMVKGQGLLNCVWPIPHHNFTHSSS